MLFHSADTPESVGNFTGLINLYLGDAPLCILPDSVGNLKGLQFLSLTGCSTLQALPESNGNLTRLRNVYLSGCSTLHILPDSVGNLTGLQFLCLSGTPLCRRTQARLEHNGPPLSLLGKCSNLQMQPNVDHLSLLNKRNVCQCNSVGNLTGLQYLCLSGCSI